MIKKKPCSWSPDTCNWDEIWPERMVVQSRNQVLFLKVTKILHILYPLLFLFWSLVKFICLSVSHNHFSLMFCLGKSLLWVLHSHWICRTTVLTGFLYFLLCKSVSEERKLLCSSFQITTSQVRLWHYCFVIFSFLTFAMEQTKLPYFHRSMPESLWAHILKSVML